MSERDDPFAPDAIEVQRAAEARAMAEAELWAAIAICYRREAAAEAARAELRHRAEEFADRAHAAGRAAQQVREERHVLQAELRRRALESA